MLYKFLIDECLSPSLVGLAVQAGYVESTCVRDRGWAGTKDWQLVRFTVEHSFTLVTHNSRDFRGQVTEQPGGYYGDLDLHAGLVCLNSVHVMTVSRQIKLFQMALDVLKHRSDLVNTSLELFEGSDARVYISIYDLPPAPINP